MIVKAEDAARINRIFENMGYAVPERAKKEMSRTQQENKSSGLGTGLTKADMRSERESVVGKIKAYQRLLQNQKKSKEKGMGREISMKKDFYNRNSDSHIYLHDGLCGVLSCQY